MKFWGPAFAYSPNFWEWCPRDGMASSDSSGPTQVKLWIRFVIGLFGEGWTHPICCPRRQRLKKSRKLRNAQLPSRGGIASAISQGRESLAIFHSLPNFSGTCTQTCHSWLFLWYHPIQDGRFHCFSGRHGQERRQDWGMEKEPKPLQKKPPSSKPPTQGNQLLHNTHSWNYRC